MLDTALYLVHYTALLLYGILLSAAFAGVPPTKRSVAALGGLFVVCGLAQLAARAAFGETLVWLAYPLLTHVPVVALLCLFFRKRLVTALAAVATAYLCCQPAKWAGLVALALSSSETVEFAVRIAMLLVTGGLILRYAASCLAAIYGKDARSVLLFGSVPLTYYAFDYSMAVYSNHWQDHTGAVAEFFPFFMALAFLAFCVAYHQTYEQKAESERRERLALIAVEQQAREFEIVRKTEHEIRLLRHDMRHVLNGVSLRLSEGNVEGARRMLAEYDAQVEATAVRRWCASDVVNYLVSDCAARCEGAGVRLTCRIEAERMPADEMAFASVLANALDNALNAQKELPEKERWIELELRTANGRLLLSVRNACASPPAFADGLPVSRRRGHGYGTQSIRSLTERLGGSCQFSADAGTFSLRAVLALPDNA